MFDICIEEEIMNLLIAITHRIIIIVSHTVTQIKASNDKQLIINITINN